MKWTGKPKHWQLQEAKAKFSQVYDLALTQGPQRVSRRGKDGVVIVRETDFDNLVHKKKYPNLMEALLACPKGPDLKIPERDPNDVVPRPTRIFE
jgi:antitoxin Phd